jgi:hypothetical protein
MRFRLYPERAKQMLTHRIPNHFCFPQNETSAELSRIWLNETARAGSLRRYERFDPTITITRLGKQGVEGVSPTEKWSSEIKNAELSFS